VVNEMQNSLCEVLFVILCLVNGDMWLWVGVGCNEILLLPCVCHVCGRAPHFPLILLDCGVHCRISNDIKTNSKVNDAHN
jgi:hypothetical protein